MIPIAASPAENSAGMQEESNNELPRLVDCDHRINPRHRRSCIDRKGIMNMDMDNHRWIVESTVEAWIAGETFMVLPNTVFVNEPGGERGAFLRYENDVLTIDGYPVDVGDYLPQFLGIIDAVKETGGVGIITMRQGE